MSRRHPVSRDLTGREGLSSDSGSSWPRGQLLGPNQMCLTDSPGQGVLERLKMSLATCMTTRRAEYGNFVSLYGTVRPTRIRIGTCQAVGFKPGRWPWQVQGMRGIHLGTAQDDLVEPSVRAGGWKVCGKYIRRWPNVRGVSVYVRC